MNFGIRCSRNARARSRAEPFCFSYASSTVIGWCVSCASATRSAIVIAIVAAASRPRSSCGASPWRSPSQRVTSAVCAITTSAARNTGGANA